MSLGLAMTESESVYLHPSKDGVGHVNVYTRGKTALGRSLSNLADIPVDHPEFGRFRTMEGLYFWCSTGKKNDMLRVVNGYKARKLGSAEHKGWNPQFKDEVMVGILCKIMQNRDLFELLSTTYTDLPFFHYYYYGTEDNSKIIVPKGHGWQMETIELIRTKIMEILSNDPKATIDDCSKIITPDIFKGQMV